MTQSPNCTTCGAAMAAGASKCENCGTTRGEQHKCPFCRVVAEAEPDAVLRFRCPACGGPRIPHASPPAAAGEALVHLKIARSARSSQLAWKTTAVTSVVFGLIAVLVMTGVLSIIGPPLLPSIAGYLLCAVPFALAAWGWRAAGGRTSQVARELDEAWFHAAKDMVTRKGIMRASDLASAMSITADQAERIMVRLASADELRPDVTESGDLAVSMRGPRLRVSPDPKVEREAGGSEPGEDEPEQQPASEGAKQGKGGA